MANLAGNSCGKILQENIAGNFVANLVEILAGKSCGKILWEILLEILWQILQENFAGNSCRRILWEILAGNLGGNAAGNLV